MDYATAGPTRPHGLMMFGDVRQEGPHIEEGKTREDDPISRWPDAISCKGKATFESGLEKLEVGTGRCKGGAPSGPFIGLMASSTHSQVQETAVRRTK